MPHAGMGGPGGPVGPGGPHGFGGPGGPGFGGFHGPHGGFMGGHGAHHMPGGFGYHGDGSGSAASSDLSASDHIDDPDLFDSPDMDSFEESALDNAKDSAETSSATDTEPNDDQADYDYDAEDNEPSTLESSAQSSPLPSLTVSTIIAFLAATFAGLTILSGLLAVRSFGYVNYAILTIPFLSVCWGVTRDIFGSKVAQSLRNGTAIITFYAAIINLAIRAIDIYASALKGTDSHGGTFLLYVRVFIALTIILYTSFPPKRQCFPGTPSLWILLIGITFMQRINFQAMLRQALVTFILNLLIYIIFCRPIINFFKTVIRRKIGIRAPSKT